MDGERQLKWFGHAFQMAEEKKVNPWLSFSYFSFYSHLQYLYKVMSIRVEGIIRRGKPRVKWDRKTEKENSEWECVEIGKNGWNAPRGPNLTLNIRRSWSSIVSLPSQHLEKFGQLLICNGNFYVENQQRLGDSICSPYVVP